MIMKILTVFLAICMLSIIGCSNDNEEYNSEFFSSKAGEDEVYQSALAPLTRLAEVGDARSQSILGTMYADGKGVPQDYKIALYWHTLAAEQGHNISMYGLGHAYRNGEGVPQNKIYAHMWYNLAHSQGHPLSGSDRDAVAEEMTATEITTAEQLAVECFAKEFKGC